MIKIKKLRGSIMGVAGFKADGYTPIVEQNKNVHVTEDQLKEAQSYVDQLASQREHVKAEEWEHVYVTQDSDGNPYLRCCFQTIGPYCNDLIYDDFYVPVQDNGSDLKRQEDQVRKWVPNAPRLKMDIFAWDEVYCINFPLGNKT